MFLGGKKNVWENVGEKTCVDTHKIEGHPNVSSQTLLPLIQNNTSIWSKPAKKANTDTCVYYVDVSISIFLCKKKNLKNYPEKFLFLKNRQKFV